MHLLYCWSAENVKSVVWSVRRDEERRGLLLLTVEVMRRGEGLRGSDSGVNRTLWA